MSKYNSQDPLKVLFYANTYGKVTDNFTVAEYASKCGTTTITPIHPSLSEGIQIIREKCAFPIRITSGHRSEEHNRAVGGSPNSLHTKGMAADLQPTDRSEGRLQRIISEARALGFVTRPYETFVHIDCGLHRNW